MKTFAKRRQAQIQPVRWRATLAGCTITVHQHLDGTFTITHGPQRLGHYSAEGVPLDEGKTCAPGDCEKDAPWEKSKKPASHLAWKSRKPRGIPTNLEFSSNVDVTTF